MRARAALKPKIHFVDSGVAGRMLRVTASRLSAAQPQAMTELGHLLETFCVGEVTTSVSAPSPSTASGGRADPRRLRGRF